ncbi:MAG: PspA/IM30 family protein [Alicyclobacillaceae bacterium]|nr:PspA/IM30 family protein [Alicyclobacillaceae bacterium]
MGLFKRAAEIVESRVNQILDRLEDPNATLDLSYEKMQEGLRNLRRSLADVVAEQKRVELQLNNLRAEVTRREQEARAALQAGREDLARAALERKQQAAAQVADLEAAHANIAAQVEKLKDAERRYQDRIDAFRTKKEVTKATYNAAKAQVRIGESITGISRELGDVGEALRRANDKAEQMMARAAAVEQLAADGTLEDVLDSRDPVERELDEIRRRSAVDEELNRLRAELSGGA